MLEDKENVTGFTFNIFQIGDTVKLQIEVEVDGYRERKRLSKEFSTIKEALDGLSVVSKELSLGCN